MELLNIGFGNLISVQRIIAVISPESAPIKRIVQEARDAGKLIDATQGRKTKSVIFTDSEHIILSYLPQEKLQERVNKGEVELFE